MIIRSDDVGLAVSIDIRHGEPVGARANGECSRGLERAITVAKQNIDHARAEVADDEVGGPVSVEVLDHDLIRAGGDGEGLHRLKGAVAVAEQHTHRVIVLVGDDEVGFAVAVEVRDLDVVRITAGDDILGGVERCRRRCPGARSPCCRPYWR